MDIYNFFYSHHNPKIKSKSLRQQEVLELYQVVQELMKALKVAGIRTETALKPPYLGQHFSDLVSQLEPIANVLNNLAEAHPGDSDEDIKELIKERSNLPSWKNWTQLIEDFNHLNQK